MTFLLDVNVLIALIDPAHVAHEDAHRWFEAKGRASWATCPITENGVIRIVGNSKYPNSPGSSALVAKIVARSRALDGHAFWPDDISLVGSPHLLALAKTHGGQLATFDRKLSPAAVKGGSPALHLIAAG